MIEGSPGKGNLENHKGIPHLSSDNISPTNLSTGAEYHKKISPEGNELSQPKEQTEISQQVVEHLRGIVGPVNLYDPKHSAIHGTSTEALMHMRRTGKLAGRTADRLELDYIAGDISILPTKRLEDVIKQLNDPFISVLEDTPNEFETSIGYANDLAGEHYFMSTLGIPLRDSEARSAAWAFINTDDNDIPPLLKKRFSIERLEQARTAAKERKGFLLGFSSAIKDDFKLMIGDPGGSDMRIRPGKEGMSYDYISGIQPLGPHEEKLLEKWGVTEKK